MTTEDRKALRIAIEKLEQEAEQLEVQAFILRETSRRLGKLA